MASDNSRNAQTLTMHKKFSQHDWLGFTAQEFLVEIVPKFSMKQVAGVGRSVYGPFAPNYPCEVPLWLAIYFRESSICTITTPEFLRVPFLADVLEKDRQNEAEYQMLPYHFFEISMQLIRVAKNDIPNVTEAIRLITEIEATRRHKLMKSVGSFTESVNLPALKLTNLVSFEIEYLRSSLALVVNDAEAIEVRSQTANAVPIVRPLAGGAVGGVGATPARTDGTGVTSETGTPFGTIGRPSTVVGSDGDYGSVGQALALGEGGGVDGSVGGSALGTQLSQQTDLTSVAMTSVTDTTTRTEAGPAPKKRRTLRQQ